MIYTVLFLCRSTSVIRFLTIQTEDLLNWSRNVEKIFAFARDFYKNNPKPPKEPPVEEMRADFNEALRAIIITLSAS